MTVPRPERRVIDVLLVEDDPGDELMIREAFEHHDIRHALHHVPDGVEAMRFLRQEDGYGASPRPDLAVQPVNPLGRSGLQGHRR